MAEKGDTSKQPVTETTTTDVALDDDDLFEEFQAEDIAKADSVTNKAALWEADWDDEDVRQDFQLKLKDELDRAMKE